MMIPLDLVLLIAAIVVSWLVFTALIKVVKTTVTTALTVAAIVFALQFLLGINPNQLWQQVTQLPQIIWQLFQR
jgi:predicted neutral ceramidase superfamily lipid hydrolase